MKAKLEKYLAKKRTTGRKIVCEALKMLGKKRDVSGVEMWGILMGRGIVKPENKRSYDRIMEELVEHEIITKVKQGRFVFFSEKEEDKKLIDAAICRIADIEDLMCFPLPTVFKLVSGRNGRITVYAGGRRGFLKKLPKRMEKGIKDTMNKLMERYGKNLLYMSIVAHYIPPKSVEVGEKHFEEMIRKRYDPIVADRIFATFKKVGGGISNGK